MRTFLIFAGFLLGFIGLSNAFSRSGDIVYSDLFVFRTGNSVFSLNKLAEYSNYLSDFKCFYPDSLVANRYELLESAPKDYFQPESFKKNNKQSHYEKVTFGFISLIKMIRYASSQSVSVSSDLPKAFRLAARSNNCSLAGFEEKGLKEEMADLVLLEVFLRSRFVSAGTAAMDEKRRVSTLKNIRSLEESVKNQIEHELFEN